MIDTLLTCIQIARNKGILFNEKDLDKADEYVKNMLNTDEIDYIHELLEDYRFCDASEIYEKLEKQKELIEDGKTNKQ